MHNRWILKIKFWKDHTLPKRHFVEFIASTISSLVPIPCAFAVPKFRVWVETMKYQGGIQLIIIDY